MAEKLNNLTGKDWLRHSISVWSDVYKTADEKKLNHPAVFPVGLALRLIQIFTNGSKRFVLDPFMGSGSTLVAAELEDKEGWGFDISEEYCKLAKSRLSKDTSCVVICDRAENVGKYLDEEIIDLVITSFPYWNIMNRKRSADYKTKDIVDYIKGDGNLGNVDDYFIYLAVLKNIFEHVYKVMKKNSWLCLNVMDLRVGSRLYLLHADIIPYLQSVGFNFEDLIIWNRQQDYNNLRPLGYPTVFRVNKVHEYILLFRKLG